MGMPFGPPGAAVTRGLAGGTPPADVTDRKDPGTVLPIRRAAGAGLALLTVVAVITGAARPAAAADACAGHRTLSVPAHQDDDVLFMNPDIQRDIDAGRCVLTVFATAGDAGAGSDYWHEREAGSRAAYAEMAGEPDEWEDRTETIAGHPLTFRTLAARPEVALVFLRLPDGDGGAGYPSNDNQSLQKLWQGTISSIDTVDGATSYTKASLTSTLNSLMHLYQPDIIRTHDYLGTYGDGDHSDHHSIAYFVLAAHQNYFSGPHRMDGYMAYAIVDRPANVSTADRDRKLAAFLAYAPHDDRVCQSADDCLAGTYGARFSRQYTTGSELGGQQNAARVATITSSSQNTGTNQQAAKAVDNWVTGYPYDSTREWATTGGTAGSWINAAWTTPHTLERVVLHDRLNAADQVTAGTLRFGDGSTVAVGALPNDGAPRVVTFAPRRVTSVRFTVTSVSSTTKNVGLAEWQAYTTNVGPRAVATASSQNTGTGQQSYKALDGRVAGSPAAPTQEWATVGGKAGSWLELNWQVPQRIGRVVLYDRPNTNDRITGARLTFGDGSEVTVPALPDNAAASTVTFPQRTVDRLRLTVTSVSATTLNIGLAEMQVEP